MMKHNANYIIPPYCHLPVLIICKLTLKKPANEILKLYKVASCSINYNHILTKTICYIVCLILIKKTTNLILSREIICLQ